MLDYCEKCSYISADLTEKFGHTLCNFCMYFSPDKKDLMEKYIQEKVDFRHIQTYRKQGITKNYKGKMKMKNLAKNGIVVSRPAFGYSVVNKKLKPNQDAQVVVNIFSEFLEKNISLTSLSKKYGFSINGIKRILTNFTYIGKIKFGKQIYQSSHNPIISSTLFNQVQDKLEKLNIKNPN